MKKIILALFISGNLFSQSWNVFNKSYRYNYKYNFSQLITNVLFADTVRQSGADTVYAMNRIGVECTGSCPTVTAALNPTVAYVVPNMPQFLQRNIMKYADGRVKLYDTTKIVIVPSCTLNQTWLFDSIYNKTAICTDISTLTVFGITDSVKTIMINNADSLQLSKNFGILLFPDPYGKNKYYRLAGIEKKSSYDQTALFGEKVPNSWDFYNYQVGDAICTYTQYSSVVNQPSGCFKEKRIIKNKIVADSSIIYQIEDTLYSYTFFTISSCPPYPNSYQMTGGTYTVNMSNLSSPAEYGNLMYPNMVYPYNYYGGEANLVQFGYDDSGRFYKFFGHPCSSYSIPILPNINYNKVFTQDLSTGLFVSAYPYYEYNMMYGEGFGRISFEDVGFEYSYHYCTSSFLRGGVSYFGTYCPSAPSPSTGIIPNSLNNTQPFFYPNPASSSITVPVIGKSQVEIHSALGQIVLTADIEGNEKIDISTIPNGIYFVTLKTSGHSVRQKLMVSH